MKESSLLKSLLKNTNSANLALYADSNVSLNGRANQKLIELDDNFSKLKDPLLTGNKFHLQKLT